MASMTPREAADTAWEELRYRSEVCSSTRPLLALHKDIRAAVQAEIAEAMAETRPCRTCAGCRYICDADEVVGTGPCSRIRCDKNRRPCPSCNGPKTSAEPAPAPAQDPNDREPPPPPDRLAVVPMWNKDGEFYWTEAACDGHQYIRADLYDAAQARAAEAEKAADARWCAALERADWDGGVFHYEGRIYPWPNGFVPDCPATWTAKTAPIEAERDEAIKVARELIAVTMVTDLAEAKRAERRLNALAGK